jgi:transglutaminase-like putative cysteine protease
LNEDETEANSQVNTAENSVGTARRRWAAAFGAATMLWCAWWYTRGGDTGVLWTLGVLGAVAVALPRPLPGTARWRIWTWLFVTFVCLVANVERIMPAEKATDGVYFLHRIVTAFLAVGAAGLFFRLNRLATTIVAAGAAPMIMRALSLEAMVKAETTPQQGQAAIWGYIALVVAFDAACRHAERRGGPASRRGERIGRVALLLAALALAAALFTPVKRSAYEMQRVLFGWSGRMGRGFMPRRSPDILLGVPLPKGFRDLTRIVLLVESDRAPGYLRENVYTAYQGGRWARGDAGEPLVPLETAAAAGAWRAYPLAEAPADGGMRRMTIEVFTPGLIDSYCIPGTAVTLHSDGEPPRMDENGMLTAEGAMPGRYPVDVEARTLSDRAFQRPRGAGRREYLAIPAGLAASVSNWVASCEGLAAAQGAREAAACIEGDFAARFAYRLDVRLSSAPDPLVHFMARREGYCVHFASAAALMLRARGVPTRLVGGFVGTERSPWLDRWVVREREGHAWVEAWDEADGRWFIVEATPAAGLPEQFEDAGRLRRTLDVLAALWKRFLYWIGQADVLIVVADAAAVAFIFAFDVLWGPPGIGLLAAVGAFSLWRRRRHRRRRTREEALRAALADAMARTARRLTSERLSRRETENWDDWLERIDSEIPTETAVELHGIVERYQRLRYRRRLDIAATEAWIREQGNA